MFFTFASKKYSPDLTLLVSHYFITYIPPHLRHLTYRGTRHSIICPALSAVVSQVAIVLKFVVPSFWFHTFKQMIIITGRRIPLIVSECGFSVVKLHALQNYIPPACRRYNWSEGKNCGNYLEFQRQQRAER